MRLHRFLAVLVIALSFNGAASKDARAIGKCYEFLSEHDKNDKFLKDLNKIWIRGWVIGLGTSTAYWSFQQMKTDNKSLGVQLSSLHNMETDEIYYTIVRDCRNEPARDVDTMLLRLYLRTDVRK